MLHVFLYFLLFKSGNYLLVYNFLKEKWVAMVFMVLCNFLSLWETGFPRGLHVDCSLITSYLVLSKDSLGGADSKKENRCYLTIPNILVKA